MAFFIVGEELFLPLILLLVAGEQVSELLFSAPPTHIKSALTYNDILFSNRSQRAQVVCCTLSERYA